MTKNKINFKQPKYILPLIVFPFLLLVIHFIGNFTESIDKPSKDELTSREKISTELGDVNNVEIKDKEDAYKDFFDKKVDGRTLIGEISDEEELLETYGDGYTEREKRKIDSLNFSKQKERLSSLNSKAMQDQKYYAEKDAKRQKESRKQEEEEHNRSMKMLEMLNGQKNQGRNSQNYDEPVEKERDFKEEQLSLMREQMMILDSIEQKNNPEKRAELLAQKKLKKNQEELDNFLNSSLKVTKNSKNQSFNSIYKQKESSFIKAVIDEDMKGYLGSRIRLRLLEDVYIGNINIKKGTVLYALINGFTLQRVNINIVSIMYENEILPINLTIYDVDGMEGLYVPESVFREMSRTLAQNTIQGQDISSTGADFFTSSLTAMFQSTSKSIADLIRKNKVKIKYNSFVYLIDKQELQEKAKKIKQK